MLSAFEAAFELTGKGLAMSPEMIAMIKQQYPQGVPEDELDGLKARLLVRTSLRVVNGGAV